MPKDIDQNASQAFSSLLKQLCINQFPCGEGSWRSEYKWRCDSPDLLNPSKEQDANLESVQSLKELSELQPFINKPDWSEDVTNLRQLAIENPETITNKNVLKQFTKLRLAGMNISNIDEGLLKFTNLKELTLSANRIEEIDPKNLPKQLELLELYGNKISDVRAFSRALPSLVHFGIGFNQVTSIIGTIQPHNWSSLMSLDLSLNDVTNLRETLETLKNLPKLSNLLLQGNPVFLSAGYRGLVVDTLKQLRILDDLRITADEKHRYKGASRLKGFPSDDAIIDIKLNNLKGVRAPQDVENESLEEFPRIDYRYQLLYFFPNNSTVKRKRKTREQIKSLDKDQSESGPDAEDRGSGSESDRDSTNIEISIVQQDITLRQKKTREKIWSEDSIEVNYEKTLVTSDLTSLKRYMAEGVVMKLIENKLVVSDDPPVLPDESASCLGEGDQEKMNKQGKGKSGQKDKSKQIPPAKPPPKDAKQPKKKKAKGEEIDLFELSRESKIIAETCLSLDDFISGSKCLETHVVLDPIEAIEKEVPNEESKESKVSSTKQSSNGDVKRKGKESRKFSPSPSATLQRNKSALSTKGGKNEKGKTKESKVLIEISETGQLQPPSDITVDVVFCLRSWKTAKEAQDWINDNVISN